MQQWIESSGICWNEAIGQYARWNQETGAYDWVVENDGLELPLVRDTEVLSVMATANARAPEASIVYPPIGPYVAGLVRVFDANSEADRDAAAKLGYEPRTCNTALRVTQGGKTTAYLLRVAVRPDDSPDAFNVTALNVPAEAGEITRAELIYCPELMAKGITAESEVLYTWPATK
jgi:hypothetical protein